MSVYCAIFRHAFLLIRNFFPSSSKWPHITGIRMAAMEPDRPSCARLDIDRGDVDGEVDGPPAKLQRLGPSSQTPTPPASLPSSPTAGVGAPLSKAELGRLLDDAVTAGDPAKVRELWWVTFKNTKHGVSRYSCLQLALLTWRSSLIVVYFALLPRMPRVSGVGWFLFPVVLSQCSRG